LLISSAVYYGNIKSSLFTSILNENLHVAGINPFGLYPINLTNREIFLYIYVSENIDSDAAAFRQYVIP
jgi:hypothetical protein